MMTIDEIGVICEASIHRGSSDNERRMIIHGFDVKDSDPDNEPKISWWQRFLKLLYIADPTIKTNSDLIAVDEKNLGNRELIISVPATINIDPIRQWIRETNTWPEDAKRTISLYQQGSIAPFLRIHECSVVNYNVGLKMVTITMRFWRKPTVQPS